MHPVLKNKWNFIAYEAAVLLFAALYAILFGLQARAGTGCIVADAVAFWGVFGLMGIILWNISNYMIPMKGMRGLRAFMITATGLLMTAITLGWEALALYLD